MRTVETVFGIGLIAAFIACASFAQPRSSSPVTDGGVQLNSCKSPLKRAPMLCDRVLIDGSAECAICVERACLSSSHIYCATSCDDPKCRGR